MLISRFLGRSGEVKRVPVVSMMPTTWETIGKDCNLQKLPLPKALLRPWQDVSQPCYGSMGEGELFCLENRFLVKGV